MKRKRFYRGKIAHAFNKFWLAKAFIIRNWNSIKKQNDIRQFSQGVSLNECVENESLGFSEALKKLRQTTTKFAPKELTPFRTEKVHVAHI